MSNRTAALPQPPATAVVAVAFSAVMKHGVQQLEEGRLAR
jgi:hypothetical protein